MTVEQENLSQHGVDAEALVDALVARKLLELSNEGAREELIAGIAALLRQSQGRRERAEALAEWLIAQRSVAELYASDDELAEMLGSR